MFELFFGYYFDNIGGTTISTNFNYTYSRTICVQYLGILLSSFEEDFQRFALKYAMFKLSLAIILPIM